MGDQRPGSGGQRPGSGDQRPGSGDQRPGSGDQRPGSGDQRPGSGDQRPGSGNRRPESGGKRRNIIKPIEIPKKVVIEKPTRGLRISDILPCSIDKVKIKDKTLENVGRSTLQLVRELGKGNFGVVELMEHTDSGISLAIKRIRCESYDVADEGYTLRDLGISMQSLDCPYTVDFYGAFFVEGEVHIIMEMMDTSLDKFNGALLKLRQPMSEAFLGQVFVSTVQGLAYLHKRLNVIHRDVKPSNILLNQRGAIKLCDYGISGILVNSLAKTKNVGCRPYMAPERIEGKHDYGIKSDVWSLGITMVELANGQFPYADVSSVFAILSSIVGGPIPTLKNNLGYSDELAEVIDMCLKKEKDVRPNYVEMTQLRFYLRHVVECPDRIIEFITPVLSFLRR